MKSVHSSKQTLKKVIDKLAEWLITIAGVTAIAAMLAMLALIVREAAPLFMSATQKETARTVLPPDVIANEVIALGVDADLLNRSQVASLLLRDGRFGFLTGQGVKEKSHGMDFSRLPNAPTTGGIHAVEQHNNHYSVLWSDGTVALYAITTDFSVDAEKNNARDRLSCTYIFGARLDMSHGLPSYVMLRGEQRNHRIVSVYGNGMVREQTLRPGKGLGSSGPGISSRRSVHVEGGGNILSAALNEEGLLYLGTDEGTIISVDLSEEGDGAITTSITPTFHDRRAVTALSFLNGDYALAAGDANGGISVWFPRREGGIFRFRQAVQWHGGDSLIRALVPSGRDRGFCGLDAMGNICWLYSTTNEELLRIPSSSSPVVALAMNGRADSMVTLATDGALIFRSLNSSYPEAGWAGFFRRLLYEGYEKPAFVWQSTGADDSEPKLSLMPLIWGSIKAAVYALCLATPIAIAAAMYLSQFAAPVWRSRIKPAVEMLAAVPSVVIGFLAALWLAPLLEQYLHPFIQNVSYDQRNALVIAIAMGFAVIPIIFSLAEDAMSAVPSSLSAASLALGASKWQTVWRVVLPTASPGIFTAVMLGLGRAVGETMIVLMAAGNTPIMSLSPFDGMRTLSANIAVEMPEAPVGGTLYRTLFLCALILFLLTLVINTTAEVFRYRLRRRYGKI